MPNPQSYRRRRKHAHQKEPGIVARQKFTPETARKRREWLQDHHEKLSRLLGSEWEK